MASTSKARTTPAEQTEPEAAVEPAPVETEAPVEVPAEPPAPADPAPSPSTAEQPQKPAPPAMFAEGYTVPAASLQAATPQTVAPGAMPTQADVDREYGQWVATGNITVGAALAFTRGQSVPASHPYLYDTAENGQGWIDGGYVVARENWVE